MTDDISTHFHAAETPAMGVDPYAVLAGGRRRRRLRVAAAGSVIAALAVAAAVTVGGLGTRNDVTLPATTRSPAASLAPSRWTLDLAKTALGEMNLTSPPSPQYFLDVEAALDAHGVANQPPRLLRFSGTGDSLAATKPLDALGAGIQISTTRRAPGAVPSEDHCKLFGGGPNSMLVEPPADRCTITRLADGVLVVVDGSSLPTTARDPATGRYQTAVTQAVFDTGKDVVSVTTWLQDTPAARKVADPHPVDAATLAKLVQDPRMRW